MDNREIRKQVSRIQSKIESAEQDITLGVLDDNVSKLYQDLKKFQNKCPHNEDTYTIEGVEYCEICQKRL